MSAVSANVENKASIKNAENQQAAAVGNANQASAKAQQTVNNYEATNPAPTQGQTNVTGPKPTQGAGGLTQSILGGLGNGATYNPGVRQTSGGPQQQPAAGTPSPLASSQAVASNPFLAKILSAVS